MERIGTKKIERFEHNGTKYRRSESDGNVNWEFYNTGWGDRGWLPLYGNYGGKELETIEKMEAMYQDQFT